MLRGLFGFALAATGAALNIVETAMAETTLSSLVTALSSYPDIKTALEGTGPFTVFAPSNDAFAKIQDMPAAAVLKEILFYHVVSSKVMASDLTGLQFPESLMVNANYTNVGDGKGQITGVSKADDGKVTINFGLPGADYTATVTTPDVECTNGVVHIIDTVLMLPKKTSETAVAGGLDELVAALTKADLVATVDDTASLTIFAPNNAAMKAAKWEDLTVDELKDVLKYHVVVGTVATSNLLTDGQKVTTFQGSDVTVALPVAGGVKVNDANVAAANILIKNGVVHIIDKVLIPGAPVDPVTTPPTPVDSSASSLGPVYVVGVVAALISLF